ncbi:MAG: retroviral-like aspartic protease family protein [Nitrospirota bacterium]
MGRIIEKIIVKNYGDVLKADEGVIDANQIRTVEVDAIVDTGATYVCLGKKDIELLGLPFHNEVSIKTANGKATRRTFKGAEIELNGRTFVMEVMENDEDTPALIGYLLLEALDFVVDPKTQKVIPNPAHDGKWVADLYCLTPLR